MNMKKTAFALIAAVAVAFAAPAFAGPQSDLQAVKKAAESPSKAKWFKVLITESGSKNAKVRITIPLRLVEALVRGAADSHLRMSKHGCEIDIKALWDELRQTDPMTFIEVEEDNHAIKVWIE